MRFRVWSINPHFMIVFLNWLFLKFNEIYVLFKKIIIKRIYFMGGSSHGGSKLRGPTRAISMNSALPVKTHNNGSAIFCPYAPSLSSRLSSNARWCSQLITLHACIHPSIHSSVNHHAYLAHNTIASVERKSSKGYAQ